MVQKYFFEIDLIDCLIQMNTHTQKVKQKTKKYKNPRSK